MVRRFLGWAGLLLALGGCSSVDFETLPPAGLTGTVIVMWVGEGGSAGDGKFLFVPDPRDPLVFTRKDQTAPGAVIQPGLMYTDGGSIPKIAQVFTGLSPWGYAPAYMIHDWLFTAHHCLVDGQTGPNYDQVRDVGFDDSAAILGEAIQGLIAKRQVERRDLAGRAITLGVDSGIARTLWDTKAACDKDKVTPADAARAAAAVPGLTHARALSAFRLPTGTPGVPAVRPAQIVARIRL